jgi:hypothetical protein
MEQVGYREDAAAYKPSGTQNGSGRLLGRIRAMWD